MATGASLITAAFNKVSVYNPTSTQTASALLSLNSFVSVLGAEGMEYAVTGESLALTVGTAEYTVGSGGDLDTVRPDRLDKCFIRNGDGYDLPMEIIPVKNYNDITSKTQEGRPGKVYFLPEYPLAKVIFDYEIDEAYTAYFDFWKPFTILASTTATVSLPVQFEEFMVYNLAVRLGEDWDRKVPLTVLSRAKETKEILQTLNASTRPPSKAKFDLMLYKRPYNINLDI